MSTTNVWWGEIMKIMWGSRKAMTLGQIAEYQLIADILRLSIPGQKLWYPPNQIKFWQLQNLWLLAKICNSTVIEMCDDMFRISHGFEGCQMLRFIADIGISTRTKRIDDITGFSPSKFPLCWRFFYYFKWANLEQLNGKQTGIKYGLFSSSWGLTKSIEKSRVNFIS